MPEPLNRKKSISPKLGKQRSHIRFLTDIVSLITAFGGALITSAGLFVYGFTALRTHFIVVSGWWSEMRKFLTYLA